MPAKPLILVIEDDHHLNQSIQEFLAPLADTRGVYAGDEGEYLASEGIFDAIILDIMLPEMDGFTVLHKLRAAHVGTPVLILTAKDGLSDKMRGFDLGTDDYLTKPFHREELMARIKVLLKRSGKYRDDYTLAFGPLTVQLNDRAVTVSGVPVALSGKEYDLLVYLLQNQGTIVTKEQIFDRLWGFDSDTGLAVVEVYMSNLRKKLKGTAVADAIRTIRNVGYILDEVAANAGK
ncbi:response regulator transcription factor [Schleiferilactobacillus harbinensis]|uniref:response regulator transcription factor n=1 Tax=Schleiferilactobacillus harbinensis TaxID=304207 RepID=UPI00345ED410